MGGATTGVGDGDQQWQVSLRLPVLLMIHCWLASPHRRLLRQHALIRYHQECSKGDFDDCTFRDFLTFAISDLL
jgi:hypothetical protein